MKSLMAGIGSLFLSVGSNLAFAHAAGKSDLEYVRFREELHRLGFDRYRSHAQDIYRYELAWLTEQEWLDAFEDRRETHGFPFYHASGRLHMSDGESLAEGGIVEHLDRLTVIMRLLGAPEFRISQVLEPDYIVTVNGTPYTVYTGVEVRTPGFDLWGVATAVTLRILNDLLETAGSRERAYSLSGGNDLCIVFLTTDMFDLYQRTSSIPERDKPQPPRPHGIRYVDD